MRSITIIEPRYHETDQMGVIHHAVYPVWYEVGRVDFLDETNMPYTKINELGFHMALIDLQVSFIKPAFFGEKLELHTWVSEVTQARVKISYEIYNLKQELINQGSTTHVFVSEDLKMVNMKKKNPEIYQFFVDQIEKQR
jgi:acyl-CoA thioester hydrolase